MRQEILLAATDPRFADLRGLILGPSRAGKEIVAREIHDLGRGKPGGPFVAVSCATISKDLLESELFGFDRGTAAGVVARSGPREEA